VEPWQIAGPRRRDGTLRISHETVYRYIWADFRVGGLVHRLLRRARKRRRGQRLGRPLTKRTAHVAVAAAWGT